MLSKAGDDELDSAVAGPLSEPCLVCGGATVLCCSGCEAAFYCSPDCQQKDWVNHRRVCTRHREVLAHSDEAFQIEDKSILEGHKGGTVLATGLDGRHVADRRRQLRELAVRLSKENRPQEMMQAAMDAFKLSSSYQRLAGEAALELAALVELLLIVRGAHASGEQAVGLAFLSRLTEMVDRVTGADGNLPVFHPCYAATLLCSTSELCILYQQEERAEDYARAYLAMVRLAHGDGSPPVGDAHGFLASLLARRGSLEEALQHAASMLRLRQRAGTDRPIADAQWNVAVLLYELGQNDRSLDNLEAARELLARAGGEGKMTACVDIALGKVYQSVGMPFKAVEALRQAVRARQRTFGFAHSETQHAAFLLSAAEMSLHNDADRQEEEQGLQDDYFSAQAASSRKG